MDRGAASIALAALLVAAITNCVEPKAPGSSSDYDASWIATIAPDAAPHVDVARIDPIAVANTNADAAPAASIRPGAIIRPPEAPPIDVPIARPPSIDADSFFVHDGSSCPPGMVQNSEQCFRVLPDAGKSCSDSSQCKGYCGARSDRELIPGTSARGTCSETKRQPGCVQYIVRGRVANVSCI